MSRQYDPKARYKNSPPGKMSPHRVAWVRADWLDVVYIRRTTTDDPDDIVEAEEAEDSEPATDRQRTNHILILSPKGRSRTVINLSAMTAAELEAVKEIIDRVFEEARGECQTRDREAQEAYENHGDDSFTRLYRPVPRVIYRKGEKPPNGEGIRIGPEGPTLIERSEDRNNE